MSGWFSQGACLTNVKRAALVGGAESQGSKWTTATLKAPWFDDESIAALQEPAVDNDLHVVASSLVDAPVEPQRTGREPSHD
jgi:hypothetical protein